MTKSLYVVTTTREPNTLIKRNVFTPLQEVFMSATKGDNEPDRYGFINHYFPLNYEIEERFKNYPTGNLKLPSNSLKDLMMYHSANLMKNHSSKRIGVFLSGGVDSTAILCSFILNGISKDRLVIVATEGSINEYPLLFRRLLIEKYNIVFIKYPNITDTIKNLVKDTYFLEGSGAPPMTSSYSNSELEDLPWKISLRKLMEVRSSAVRNYSTKEFSETIDMVEQYSKLVGLKLTYLHDVHTLMALGFRFIKEDYDIKLLVSDKSLIDNSETYFHNIIFQEFQFQNYESYRKPRVELSGRNYKTPMKELIYEYTKDDAYFDNKLGYRSVKNNIYKITKMKHTSIYSKDGYYYYDNQGDISDYSSYFHNMLKDYKKEGFDLYE